MIRNVVMVKLKPDTDPAWVAEMQRKFQSLNTPGTVAYTIGSDEHLREGNWSFAIVSDFVDADAYRRYDADAAHNALRDELAPAIEQAGRVQFEV